MKTNTVLIASREKTSGEAIRLMLEGQSDLDVSLVTLDAGHADPLHEQRSLPDILMLVIEKFPDANTAEITAALEAALVPAGCSQPGTTQGLAEPASP